MLSTRKDEVKAALLTFFPKVLTTIIADYEDGPGLDALRKFVTENKSSETKPSSVAANKYYIAAALLKSLETLKVNHNSMDHMRVAIASCYAQHALIINEANNVLVENHHWHSDQITVDLILHFDKFNSYILPKNFFKTERTPQSTRHILTTDTLHNIFVDLYTQCGGKTKEDNLSDDEVKPENYVQPLKL